MKILHIITRLIVGGAQQNTITCCAAQVAAGHEVWLAYGPIYGPEGSLLEDAKKSGANLFEVRSMRRAIMPLHDMLCRGALSKLIRRIKPDVVHTHSSKAGIIGRAAAWKEHMPAVIHTIHGLPFHEHQPRFVHNLYVHLERRAAKQCHKLIGVTQAMCDAFRDEGIGRPGQFIVVPSGIDLEMFRPAAAEPGSRSDPAIGGAAVVRRELGIPEDAPVVGIVARLDKLKGQDDLLDVMPALIAKHPDIKLLIVGDGWNRSHLEQRVAREKLANHVIFTGLVTPARVAALLGVIDVNTLPSYQEGQPRTLVQALLCGCAIVGYDAGGIGEVCIDGQTGRLVPVGNRAALGDAIAWMLDHPAERKKLAEQGRKYAVERFDAKVMVRRVEEIYREVLESNDE